MRLWFPLLVIVFLLAGCSGRDTPTNSWEHAADGSYSAALSRDGHLALVSSVHHGIGLWDLEHNQLKYRWDHQQQSDNLVLSVALSDDGNYAITADSHTFVIWHTDSGEAEGYWNMGSDPECVTRYLSEQALDPALAENQHNAQQQCLLRIRDVAISNNGRHVLLGLGNGKVVFQDMDSGRRLEFLGHQEKINTLALSPNGRYALTGGNDYVAYLWDTRTAQPLYRFVHPSRVTKVALHHNGKYAFTADSKRQATIWDLSTGQPVSQLQFEHRQNVFSAVRFSDDGSLLATGAPSRALVLWDTQTGKQLQQWHVTPRTDTRPESAVVHAVSFFGDNSLLTESSAGLAETWPITVKLP